MSRTLQDVGPWRLRTLDQTLLPHEERWIVLEDANDCHQAIFEMRVRGAPLIGAVAAFGLAFALRVDASEAGLARACRWLAGARPTAVNAAWALERLRRRVSTEPAARRAAVAWQQAQQICEEDVRCNQRIGELGAALLSACRRGSRSIQVLTHCNAGRLATVDHGTALAPVYALHRAGIPVHVWVDETRPRNQGASLTAWELAQSGIAHTLIADNAAGLLMWRGEVDVVITGCDRVAANGDVANKVGTYQKALAARDNGLPFYVACPTSTIDARCAEAAQIEIESRDPSEVTHVSGRADDGRIVRVALAPPGTSATNPAFDLTPARLVTALVTEHGVVLAHAGPIAELLARRCDVAGSVASGGGV